MAGLGKGKNIWVIANWKSNKTIVEALEWISKVGSEIPKQESLKVVVCPTFSNLSEVKKAILVGGFPLMVGAQDLSPFDGGAYTGEESASLIKELINLSILGHSERRKNFAEDDLIIAQKVKQAKESNIIPLLCIQSEETPIPGECRLVAYEPVWAIGSGNPDTPQNANGVADKVKQKLGNGLEILYGGSVTSQNIKEFIEQENISGVLVGNASLNAEEFIKICKSSSEYDK